MLRIGVLYLCEVHWDRRWLGTGSAQHADDAHPCQACSEIERRQDQRETHHRATRGLPRDPLSED